ncbi:hypothetical protein C8F04DRAFT_1180375 [Mycena alexandri]|uniref:Uncharacterized protein n=1 Tax=Mycena alexandri TaxID=1745969 RepID=A0AAD6T4G9_9AGAR|nr:hypothetical protein C8F04DRAFT_1180375 [Mycena alexandri]
MDDRGAGVDGVRVGPPAEVGCQKAALEKLSNPSLGRIFGQQTASWGGAPMSAITSSTQGGGGGRCTNFSHHLGRARRGGAARDGALGNPGSPIYTRFIGYFLVILRWRVREAHQHWPSRWARRAGADSGPPIAEAHVGWRRDECAWRAGTARDGAFVTF